MSNSVPETSLGADLLRYLRYQLRGRRGLVATSLGIGAAALWFGWPLLMAAGLAPILIALAPCAIMCAVGVCTMKACSTGSATKADPSAIPYTPDEMIEPFNANELAEGIAGPAAAAAPPMAGLAPVQSENVGSSGKLPNQGKEKTR